MSRVPKLRRRDPSHQTSPQSFILRKYKKISSSEIPVKDFLRKILPVSQHTRFEVLQKKEQLCHQIIIKFKHQGHVEICEKKGISLSCWGWIDITYI